MQNDEITPEVELDENQIDETVEETVEETEETTTQEEKDWKAEALRLKSEAIKWEQIAKRKAKQAQPQEAKLTKEQYLTREEGILIAKGMDDEAINQLKIISKGKGVSLLEAEKDPLFTTYFEKIQRERKAEKAKLGVSKGSGIQQNKETFRPGLTREEHMALWKGQ